MDDKRKIDNESLNDADTPLSLRIFEKKFEEVKGVFGISGKKAYLSDEVDRFLTAIGEEVEKLENTTAKLYKFYESRIRDEKKNSNQAYAPSEEKQTGRDNTQIDDNVKQTLSRKNENEFMQRMQNQMNKLLLVAEQSAEERVTEAELEAKSMIENAKKQSQNIIEGAQNKSLEVERLSQEKIKELAEVKREIEVNARKLKEDFEAKAIEVENMGTKFQDMGRQIRQYVSGETEGRNDKNKTA